MLRFFIVLYLGGVILIQGKETYGTTELVQYIPELCKILDRYYFPCSNMVMGFLLIEFFFCFLIRDLISLTPRTST
jgi:hypothetical protein